MSKDITRSIRESYDRLAEEYASRLFTELERKPFDRVMLDRFADEVRGSGEVCDMGCGPGHVARFLRDAKVQVFGLDLSPRMIAEARRLNPDITFCEGDVLGLPILDGSLAGIAAFYAIVNFPEELLPRAFREMARVLQPGGVLLLAFHVGDQALQEDELWGHAISMNFFLFPPSAIRRHLEEAGLRVENIFERLPYPPDVEYQSRRAYVLARKPRG
ncbi:MAG: methyltransferase domain-containing protein [Hyphomicrobiales bacterium]|nr:methyltransferase domain-containing protein [Hyphomicrobiales bacterium]MBV9111602.1 methyltransferase domain-containing protein [Hyphomicrobiales bacterium]MBV9520607.1 methyltransferase domain-containing protein [Hyphomicrobiales bacterium]